MPNNAQEAIDTSSSGEISPDDVQTNDLEIEPSLIHQLTGIDFPTIHHFSSNLPLNMVCSDIGLSNHSETVYSSLNTPDDALSAWQVQVGQITLDFLSDIGYGGYALLPPLPGDPHIEFENFEPNIRTRFWVVNGHGQFESSKFELPAITLVTPEALEQSYTTAIDREYHLEEDFKLGYVKSLQDGKWTFYHQDDYLNDIAISPWDNHQELTKFAKSLSEDTTLWSKIDGELGHYLERDPEAMLVIKRDLNTYVIKQGKDIIPFMEKILQQNRVPLAQEPVLFLAPKIGKIKVLASMHLSEITHILSEINSEAVLLCATCNASPYPSMNKRIQFKDNSERLHIDLLNRLNDMSLLSYQHFNHCFLNNQAANAHKVVARYYSDLNAGLEYGPLVKNQATYDFERIVKALLEDNREDNVTMSFTHDDCIIRNKNIQLSISEVLQDMDWRFVDVQCLSQLYESYLLHRSSYVPKTITSSAVYNKSDFNLPPGTHQDLTFGEMAAINIYTQEEEQSGGQPLYKILNQLLRSPETQIQTYENSEETLKEILIHAGFLASAINHADSTSCKFTYRVEGALPPMVYQARLMAAQQHTLHNEGGFVSVSSSSCGAFQALSLANSHHHTILHNFRGVQVGNLSCFNEDEIILAPGPMRYDQFNLKGYFTNSVGHQVCTPTGLSQQQRQVGLGHFKALCYEEFKHLFYQLSSDLNPTQHQRLLDFWKGYEARIESCFSSEFSEHEQANKFYEVLGEMGLKLEQENSCFELNLLKGKLNVFIEYNQFFAAIEQAQYEKALIEAESYQSIRDAVAKRFETAMNSKCAARWLYDEKGFAYSKHELKQMLEVLGLDSLAQMKLDAIYPKIPYLIIHSVQRLSHNQAANASSHAEITTVANRGRSHTIS